MSRATRTSVPRVVTGVETVARREVAAMTETIAVDATGTEASAAIKESNGGTTAGNTTLLMVDQSMNNDTLAHIKIAGTDALTAETGGIPGVDSTTEIDNMTVETEDTTAGTEDTTAGTEGSTVGTDDPTTETDALTAEIEDQTTETIDQTAGTDGLTTGIIGSKTVGQTGTYLGVAQLATMATIIAGVTATATIATIIAVATAIAPTTTDSHTTLPVWMPR